MLRDLVIKLFCNESMIGKVKIDCESREWKGKNCHQSKLWLLAAASTAATSLTGWRIPVGQLGISYIPADKNKAVSEGKHKSSSSVAQEHCPDGIWKGKIYEAVNWVFLKNFSICHDESFFFFFLQFLSTTHSTGWRQNTEAIFNKDTPLNKQPHIVSFNLCLRLIVLEVSFDLMLPKYIPTFII